MTKNLTAILLFYNNTSSNPYILLSKYLMGCLRQHRDSEKLKSPYSHIKDDHTPNSHLGFLQPTSSFKPYVLFSRNLIEGFQQHGDSEVAKIISFAYQRLPSTKQPSWYPLNIIIFQTIYPLEQKLDGRQQADRLHRKA